MNFDIRKIILNDIIAIRAIDAIHEIRQQNIKYIDDDSEYVGIATNGIVNSGIYRSVCYVVAIGKEVVGYYMASVYETAGLKCCYLGWNFHPSVWGTGVTVRSNESVRNVLTDEFGSKHFIAECFRDNHRCRKYMLKSGYIQQSVPLLHQLYHMYYWKTLRLSVRYYCKGGHD